MSSYLKKKKIFDEVDNKYLKSHMVWDAESNYDVSGQMRKENDEIFLMV